jgi:hypothetical protein
MFVEAEKNWSMVFLDYLSVILKYILKNSFTDNIILFTFYITPFPVSPKGEMICSFPPSLSRSFSEAKVGEGWEGGNSNFEFTMFVLAEKNWSIDLYVRLLFCYFVFKY